MHQKIKNVLHVQVEGAKLTTAQKIEFYVRQGEIFFQYTPTVVSDTEMTVMIPKADADLLRPCSKVYLQFVYTDENGNDIPSDTLTENVDRLLKQEGYDGC